MDEGRRQRVDLWVQLASSAAIAIRDETTSWQRVERDILRMLASGLAMALPIAIGLRTGNIGEATVMAIGALMVSSSGHIGDTAQRSTELLVSAVVGATGVSLGNVVGGSSVGSTVAIIAGSVVAAGVGSLRPSCDKAALQFAVTTIIGSAVASSKLATATVVDSFAIGALLGSALTLVAYGANKAVRGGRAPAAASQIGSWAVDLRIWGSLMATPQGWHFPFALGSCMLVGGVAMHLLPGSHTSWVLLTVVIVVQRDQRAAVSRTISRAVGTLLGVVVGVVVLKAVSVLVTVAVVGVIGAIRGHLKAASYTAYSLVMTPLVLVLTDPRHRHSGELLFERGIDTVLGCLIALCIGRGVWRCIRWGSQCSDEEVEHVQPTVAGRSCSQQEAM